MLSAALALTVSMVVTQADNPLPAEVVSRLEFMAGEWKSEGTFRVEPWTGIDQRRLSPSRTALLMTGKSNVQQSAGITGWDPDTNELVETWYNTMGDQVVIRYKIVPDAVVWEGTVHVHARSGEHEEGTCRLEKIGKDSFKWTSKTNKTEAAALATRVKRGK